MIVFVSKNKGLFCEYCHVDENSNFLDDVQFDCVDSSCIFRNCVSMNRFQRHKNSEPENNHITITNTFWSTEFNFGPFLSHEVSICVSESQSNHFQSSKIGFRDKKSPQSKIPDQSKRPRASDHS